MIARHVLCETYRFEADLDGVLYNLLELVHSMAAELARVGVHRKRHGCCCFALLCFALLSLGLWYVVVDSGEFSHSRGATSLVTYIQSSDGA